MKKTLIALSLAALSTAAVADVTLYGQIKAGVEVAQTKVKNTDASGNVTRDEDNVKTQIADFGSRIGFKGHESLGNGLNAIWQLEQSASIAGTDKGWGTRDSYIGLESAAGTLRAGKLSTQLKDMGTIDPWEYSNNALGLGMFTRTGTREISARYDSPVFAGFSFNVQFTPRDNQSNARNAADATGRTSNLSDSSAYYAGLNYENAGFFAQYGAGFRKSAYVANATGESKSGQAHRVEVGYDANNLFAGLGYQYTNGWDSVNSYEAALMSDSSYDATTDTSAGAKTQEVAATVAYRFGNVTPRLSYAHGFDVKATPGDIKLEGTKYDQVVLGADYDFSKRTTAFAQAGWLKAGKSDNKIETTAGLVGLRHKF